MKIYRFNAEIGRLLAQFDHTNFTLSHLLGIQGEFDLVCLELGPNFHMDYHQAPQPQLLLVVDGKGWLWDEKRGKTPIHAGQGVFLEQGQWHEVGTNYGMSVILIEGENLQPDTFMQEAI